ncbi:hypothetical protein BX616_006875, partial [Lobosporangium transversale]
MAQSTAEIDTDNSSTLLSSFSAPLNSTASITPATPPLADTEDIMYEHTNSKSEITSVLSVKAYDQDHPMPLAQQTQQTEKSETAMALDAELTNISFANFQQPSPPHSSSSSSSPTLSTDTSIKLDQPMTESTLEEEQRTAILKLLSANKDSSVANLIPSVTTPIETAQELTSVSDTGSKSPPSKRLMIQTMTMPIPFKSLTSLSSPALSPGIHTKPSSNEGLLFTAQSAQETAVRSRGEESFH